MSAIMSALLCQTVTGRSMAEILAAREAAETSPGVGLIELRVDGVHDLDAAGVLKGRRKPVVVTCRPAWEGGRFEGAEEDRLRILRAALDGGAEYVDVEWRAGFSDLIRQDPVRVVVSSHDATGVPADLEARAAVMRQSGAALIRIGVTARRLSDTLPLLAVGRSGGAVVSASGDAGVATRLLAARFGSLWACTGEPDEQGHLGPRRIVEELGFLRVGPATAIFGVVGNNVMHSKSPVMHNAAFAALGIDAAYLPMTAESFDDFLTFASALGVQGASVTIPFKLDALRAAHTADDLTHKVGAANTLKRDAGGWSATNTDVGGFLDAVDALVQRPLRGVRAAVLGAGGAARAVSVALQSRGACVTLHARREAQAADVAARLGTLVGPATPPRGSWDLLVNCTPLGGPTARDVSPLPGGPLDGEFVYDLNYGKGESALVREAQAAGRKAVEGLPMLIAQAERQFEWWTGQRPPAGVMHDAIRRGQP